ncbi:DedA family protein [Micromonospora narathiwatensis]|uniref:Membrane protein DedA, SNARE-associated domain n=1 Tax=Micromonospora narathiwatensis TaxID=299146 RepID=A0A1A9A2M0_9ACTN|nr:DedA family protein [Micromonospora narathiwatensis]SBT50374.1 membrane protein DedA, SNARE-associated domain [Micromonospora narathiwatensis]
MTLLDSLLDRLGTLPPAYVLLAAAAVLAAEVGLLVGMVLPAATTMLTVGLLARAGRLDLDVALSVTTLAAFAGDQLGYLEGRLLGPRLRRGRLGRWVGEGRWRRAENLVAARGGPAVLLGRWTAFVRTLVPRVAGAAGLPYRRFVLFDALAVAVWVPGTVLLGWAVGAAPTALPAAAGVLVVAAVAVAFGGHRFRVRRDARTCPGPVRGRRRLTDWRDGSRPTACRRPGAGRSAPARRGALDRS